MASIGSVIVFHARRPNASPVTAIRSQRIDFHAKIHLYSKLCFTTASLA